MRNVNFIVPVNHPAITLYCSNRQKLVSHDFSLTRILKSKHSLVWQRKIIDPNYNLNFSHCYFCRKSEIALYLNADLAYKRKKFTLKVSIVYCQDTITIILIRWARRRSLGTKSNLPYDQHRAQGPGTRYSVWKVRKIDSIEVKNKFSRNGSAIKYNFIKIYWNILNKNMAHNKRCWPFVTAGWTEKSANSTPDSTC